jgi:hypothetical protein
MGRKIARKGRQMGILDWWRNRDSGAASAHDSQRIDETIERVVQMTNPRLKFARRYRARLAPAVETALAHAHDLVASAPPAREASRAGWASDPYMQSFFATADDLVQALSRAPDLRAHIERNPVQPEAYALLGMQMTERKVLGMAMEGDQVRGEVQQTTLSFSDHRVRVCGRTESELRAEIERRLVDQLALEGLARVVAGQSNRTELEQQRAVLRSRLRMLERKGTGMRGALGYESLGQDELARLQSQLDENAAKLGGAGGGVQALDHELEQIRSVLAESAQHLYLTSRRLRIDKMNVVIEDGSSQAGAEYEFQVAKVPGTNPPLTRAFALVRFPCAELLPRERLLEDAARLLG